MTNLEQHIHIPPTRPNAIAAWEGKLYDLPSGAVRWWNLLINLCHSPGNAIYRAAICMQMWATLAECEWERDELIPDLQTDPRLRLWREMWLETHAHADAALKVLGEELSPELLMYVLHQPTSDESVEN